MRIERLSGDKVRFFLSSEDLVERGIERDDMWQDLPKVHDLFNDMMEKAYRELGFEVHGPVAVEVFALPAQGMVVIVTRGDQQESAGGEWELESMELEDEFYEYESNMESDATIICRFRTLEDCIHVAHRLYPQFISGGQLYHYQDHYYLVLLRSDLGDEGYQDVIAILSEYGEMSGITIHVLEEYGKLIMQNQALEQICRYFS
ncbi:genetic competence negative regulator [Rubeoparvulum massiliense]|uniref:genetic competence negative regulator n=1 Tax=Rubeoparvulum massiliense TaxID=1631346 RepID=UPI00065E3656|nr:genetic competence negative regulator [Rubeoparvulum massiliense]